MMFVVPASWLICSLSTKYTIKKGMRVRVETTAITKAIFLILSSYRWNGFRIVWIRSIPKAIEISEVDR